LKRIKGHSMIFKFLKNITLYTAITFSSFSSLSHAGLIIDTDNDSFIDATTGLEWMDFGINNGRSFNDVVSNLSDSGDYAGWRLPTYDEVFDMWHHAFFDEIPSGRVHVISEDDIQASAYFPLNDTFEAIGYNTKERFYSLKDDFTRGFGLFQSKGDSDLLSYVYFRNDPDYDADTILLIGSSVSYHNSINLLHSTLLVRGDSSSSATSVSEPATFAIFALCVLAMATRRFKKSL